MDMTNKTRITNKQIAAIARESKELSSNGLGNQLAIFADGHTSMQPSRQFMALVGYDGTRIYPLCWLGFPQTRKAVEQIVRMAELEEAAKAL